MTRRPSARPPHKPRLATDGLTRNNALYDTWSLVHITSGILLGWLASPVVALAILILWEPLEIFVVSPLLARVGIVFGYEAWRNSLSDIFFDLIGWSVGYLILARFIEPPFHLFM